jgi:hypothetical protein
MLKDVLLSLPDCAGSWPGAMLSEVPRIYSLTP